MHPDRAYENFLSIYEKYHDKRGAFNEADTRAKIIDFILRDCLGWQEYFIIRENPNASGYTDYELTVDEIPVLVVEAKKSGEYFEIPETTVGRTYKISGVISTSKKLIEAFNQVRAYCNDIGCKFAAVFNGYQIALFSAITLGKPWKEGQCIVYKSLEDIKNNFTQFWNSLSFDNFRKGSLRSLLEGKRRDLSFKKIISEIHNPDQSWARNELYIFIRPICDFVFSELLDEARTEVLKECYVYDEAAVPLSEEIESYFVDKLPHFAEKYKISQIYQTEVKAGAFQKKFLRKSYDKTTGALIVLLGGVGAGKSTFLHRFFRIILAAQESLLWFYIDFRGAPLREVEIEDFIFNKMNESWEVIYEPKLRKLLEEVGFNVEKNDMKEFFKRLFNLLHHLKFSLTIIVDNVDQHEIHLQEKIFLCSHYVKDILQAVTIVALREETFMASTRSGVFDAYHIQKFHISSPNFLGMIFKRIDFTIKLLAEKKLHLAFPSISKDARGDLIKYFTIIKNSLSRKNEQSRKIVKFIDSVSVGNMRDALRMFNNFIVSGNTNIKEIFSKNKKSGSYQLAYHQFIKSIILGEYKYYIQDRSQIINMFDFDPSLTDSHFNILRILKFLMLRSNKKSSMGRGYVLIDDLLAEAERVSIPREAIVDSLLRLSNFNLLEYDNQSRTDIQNATYVKITAAGSYYFEVLVNEFIYLDCILGDTPISDNDTLVQLRKIIHTTDLEKRLERTQAFLDYLTRSEKEEYKTRPEYLHSEFSNQYFTEEILDHFKELEKGIIASYRLHQE